MAATPTKEYGSATLYPGTTGADAFRSYNGPQQQQHRLSLSLGIGQGFGAGSLGPGGGGPVLIRKVTRNSPDSDDTDTVDMDGDDAFLMADRNEGRYYGSVHANSPRMSRWETQMRYVMMRLVQIRIVIMKLGLDLLMCTYLFVQSIAVFMPQVTAMGRAGSSNSRDGETSDQISWNYVCSDNCI